MRGGLFFCHQQITFYFCKMMMGEAIAFGRKTFSPISKFPAKNLLSPNICSFPILINYSKHNPRVQMGASRDSAITKPQSEGGLGQQRNSANYHPSAWGDHFLQYHSNSYSLDSHEKDLIAKVKDMLSSDAGDTLALLKLIDQLQRFGVAYHFEDDIDFHLAKFAETYPNLIQGRDCDDDLYMVSLLFRLLRQHGYYVSSDVFNKFKDTATAKFRESLARNVLGILSLFEASYMLVPVDVALEEALAFTSCHLESVDEKRESPFTAKLARHTLRQPIRQGFPRVEAWRHIRIHQDDVSCNEMVLALAKLDFNSLQKMHQKEACDIVRWWKDHDFTGNLPFARDRIVECYLWALSVYFEPEFSFARKFLAKITALASLMDDIFDAYGTLEELELFTEALERWDMSTTDSLPEYMRFYYSTLVDVYDEIQGEMSCRGHLYRLDHAKRSMKDQAKAYLEESKWFHKKYIASTDEYVALASKTVALKMLVVHSLVGMGEVITQDSFEWLSGNPHVVQSSAAAIRFFDDIVGHKFERERGHVVSSIDCVVRQYGCTEQEAEEMIRKWIFESWKETNEACLRPLEVPMPVLERILNWLRSTSVFYEGSVDNYTQCTTRLKDVGAALLVDPLPL